MNEGTPINEHLKEIKVLDDKLASIGARCLWKIKQLLSLGAYKPLLCNRRKLDVKAENLRFIGYNKSCKDYQFYNEHTNKATIRQDVVFDDTSLLQTGV